MVSDTKALKAANKAVKRKKTIAKMKEYWQIYILILPGLLFYLIFKVVPMWGLSVAFFDYDIFGGLLKSEFVGFGNFIDFFQSKYFFQMFRNTIVISLMNLIFYFPAPIILSLLINEVKSTWFKRINQTIIYLPHFLSWVVITGLTFFMLSTDIGAVNKLIMDSGNNPIAFLSNKNMFWWVILGQTIWREAGWGTILFLAAISQIDPAIYEAATIDGANRMQQIWGITLPSIMPTIIVLFIIRMGRMMDVSFEQILLMSNEFVMEVAEVFDTYTFTQGVQRGNFSVGATVGICKSIIGLVLVILSNKIIKSMGYEGIY
jgi:putative aldouronate transport system permease protein